jgi:hypothetical protein
MGYRVWLSLLFAAISSILGLTTGALLVELVRLAMDKARRERELERIKILGLWQVIRKALFEDPQGELELRKPHHDHA